MGVFILTQPSVFLWLELFLTKNPQKNKKQKQKNLCPPPVATHIKKFIHTNFSSSLLYISRKFLENVVNGFQAVERIWNYLCRISKGDNSKKCIDKSYCSCVLHVIWSCFIFLWNFMKISWAVFKVKSWHKITIVEFKRENNSKNVQTRVMVLAFCMSSADALYFYEV